MSSSSSTTTVPISSTVSTKKDPTAVIVSVIVVVMVLVIAGVLTWYFLTREIEYPDYGGVCDKNRTGYDANNPLCICDSDNEDYDPENDLCLCDPDSDIYDPENIAGDCCNKDNPYYYIEAECVSDEPDLADCYTCPNVYIKKYTIPINTLSISEPISVNPTYTFSTYFLGSLTLPVGVDTILSVYTAAADGNTDLYAGNVLSGGTTSVFYYDLNVGTHSINFRFPETNNFGSDLRNNLVFVNNGKRTNTFPITILYV